MAQLDANINVTLEVDDDTWYELLEVFDGDEDEALYALMQDLESESGTTVEGAEWWACSAENGGWILPPEKDKRPL